VEIVLFLILEVVLREELLKNMKHKVRDSRTKTRRSLVDLTQFATVVNPFLSIGTDTDYFCDRFDILTSGEKFVIGRYPFNCSDYLYNKAKGWCF